MAAPGRRSSHMETAGGGCTIGQQGGSDPVYASQTGEGSESLLLSRYLLWPHRGPCALSPWGAECGAVWLRD